MHESKMVLPIIQWLFYHYMGRKFRCCCGCYMGHTIKYSVDSSTDMILSQTISNIHLWNKWHNPVHFCEALKTENHQPVPFDHRIALRRCAVFS